MKNFPLWTISFIVLFAAAACVTIAQASQTDGSSEVSQQTVVSEMTRPATSETPAPLSQNVAVSGSGRASSGNETSQLAIDGNEDTLWSAQAAASQWFLVYLDDFYRVNKIEMVVTQAPAGPTTHELWLGNDSGVLTLFTRLSDLFTEDGQTLELSVDPPRAINEVLILTRDSPSWVAWREVRVFGSPSLTE